jgi:hypothetical protein
MKNYTIEQVSKYLNSIGINNSKDYTTIKVNRNNVVEHYHLEEEDCYTELLDDLYQKLLTDSIFASKMTIHNGSIQSAENNLRKISSKSAQRNTC